MKENRNYKIQILRALSIIAVVLIHTCPNGISQAIYRPFINFAVATFLFLSSYLINFNNTNWKLFIKKRIIRVLIPYILWTIIYSLSNFKLYGFSLKILLFNLFTTKSTGTLYYIFVYIQFTLLTPLLKKLSSSKYKWFGFIISPLSLIVFKYLPLITNSNLNKWISIIWDISFIGWFNYYYLGLLLGNKIINNKFNIKKLCLLYILSIPIQMIEGSVLLSLGEFNCGTQLKLTVLLTNTIFILLSYYFINNNKIIFKNNLLILIGDYSFGIYLSHIMIINLLNTIPTYTKLPYMINSTIVLIISFIFVIIAKKIYGIKISKYCGFC